MRIIVPDSSANFLIGTAKTMWKMLDEQRQDLRLPIKKETLEVLGFLIFLYSSETNNYIKITGGSFKGFLCHPRTDAGNGWDPKGEALPSGPYAYPLIDDDKGTRGVQLKKTGWSRKNKPPENYGNIDWKGEKDVLTWKGPPSRYFPLDSSINYPGLTVEEELVGTTFYFTPFGPNIYKEGKIYDTTPALGVSTTKVLGAAKLQGKLVGIFGTNYRDAANPAGTTGGFFFEAWMKDGEWKRLGFVQGERGEVPWFFNQSGNEAQTVQGFVRHKVVITPDSATFSQSSTTVTESESTVTSTATQDDVPCIGPDSEEPGVALLELGYHLTGHTLITQTGKRIIAVDYKGDTEVLRYAEMNNSVDSQYEYKKQGYSTDSILVPNEPSGMPYPPTPTVWVDAADFGDEAQINYGGFCGTPIFSTSCGEVEDLGGGSFKLTGLMCCSDEDITITGSDENGCRTVEYTFHHNMFPPPDYPGSWELRLPHICGIKCFGYETHSNIVFVMGPLIASGTETVTSNDWPPCGWGIACGTDGMLVIAGGWNPGNLTFYRFAYRHDGNSTHLTYATYVNYSSHLEGECP